MPHKRWWHLPLAAASFWTLLLHQLPELGPFVPQAHSHLGWSVCPETCQCPSGAELSVTEHDIPELHSPCPLSPGPSPGCVCSAEAHPRPCSLPSLALMQLEKRRHQRLWRAFLH